MRMSNLQPDLFLESFPIQKVLWSEKANDIWTGVKLDSKYNTFSVYFQWIENKDVSNFIAKIQIHKRTSKGIKKQNIQLHFYLDERGLPKLFYTDEGKPFVTFGKNTFRPETSKYDWNIWELQNILWEIGRKKPNKIASLTRQIQETSENIFICPTCRDKFNGCNCTNCGFFNTEGELNFSTAEKDTTKFTEIMLEDMHNAHEVQQAKDEMRKVRGLKFLPNQSDINTGEFIFTDVPLVIWGQETRRKIKVVQSNNWGIQVYVNPSNWTKQYIESRQKFWQISAAIREINGNIPIAAE